MSKPSPVALPSLPSSSLLSLSRFHFLGGRSQLLSSLLISLPFRPPPAATPHTACVCVCARATMRGDEREGKTEKRGEGVGKPSKGPSGCVCVNKQKHDYVHTPATLRLTGLLHSGAFGNAGETRSAPTQTKMTMKASEQYVGPSSE